MVRVMVGTRISIIVGVCAAIIVLIIGALYGSVSGYCGGAVDTVMQRIVEIIYSIPEMLIILLLSATLKPALEQFLQKSAYLRFYGQLQSDFRLDVWQLTKEVHG